jgi:hypothetical protein
VKFNDLPSRYGGKRLQQITPIFLGYMHPLGIHNDSNHHSDRLIAGSTFVAIADLHWKLVVVPFDFHSIAAWQSVCARQQSGTGVV